MGAADLAAGSTRWPAELERLYGTERTGFVRLAYLLVGRADVAEELVQESFVACAPKWSTVTHPKAYLRTAVTNRARDWLRREQMHRERVVTVVPEPVLDNPDELWDALERLDERRRTAVVLRYYQDLPDDEIARILDCRPATVRSLIHRALKDLRREVTP